MLEEIKEVPCQGNGPVHLHLRPVLAQRQLYLRTEYLQEWTPSDRSNGSVAFMYL